MRHVLLAMSLAVAACVGMNVGSVEECAALCEQAAGLGVRRVFLGMPHRGRVNVLVILMGVLLLGASLQG